jgi:hypothetical protein
MKWRDEYGGIHRLWNTSLVPIVRVNHPEAAKVLMSTWCTMFSMLEKLQQKTPALDSLCALLHY